MKYTRRTLLRNIFSLPILGYLGLEHKASLANDNTQLPSSKERLCSNSNPPDLSIYNIFEKLPGKTLKINNEKQFVMFENTLWKPKVQSNYPIVLKGESKDVIDILNQNFSLIITPNNDMNKTNTNIVLASHFGVKGNGIPCGEQCVAAINYIMINGGTLLFPPGEINWGKIRGNFNVKNGPNFKLLGTPGKTVFTFDNIDPIKINKLWGHSEPALITIGSNSTISSEYTSSFIMESIKIDYSRQKNQGGPTYNTMNNGAHPTPYSDGTLAIHIMYADSPILKDIEISNVYGSGICIWKCTDAIIQNVTTYNVSANQVLSADGKNESVDHFGYSIWSGASANTKISNCKAFNYRVYSCDPKLKSPHNNEQYDGKICGYIGIYCEYSPIQGNKNIESIHYEWLSDENTDKRGYAKVINCFVRGYTFGFKSESLMYIHFDNCKAIYNYIGFSIQASALIENCYINGLTIDYERCPQQGIESQRGGVCFSWWSGENNLHEQYLLNSYIESRKYQCISLGKGTVTIQHNTLRIYESAALIKTVTSFELAKVKISENRLIIDNIKPITSPEHIRITNTQKTDFSENYLYNLSNAPCELNISNGTLKNNLFNGNFKYISTTDYCVIDGNTFSDIKNRTTPEFIFLSSKNTHFSHNIIHIHHIEKIKDIIFLSKVTNFSFIKNNIIVDKNYFSENTIENSLLKTFGECQNLLLSDNIIVGSKNIKLHLLDCSGVIDILRCERNTTDSDCSLFYKINKFHAPWFISNNNWHQTYDFEINTADNISRNYKASLGDMIHFL
ncbi:TPA: hypothetical protein MCS71_004068, partial [Klebsiella pneumoniae]|nr:hypothetical protein [Klebsiella pneumoniae]HBU0769911.1 hypothetical protein [Klebsiella pneumoniae]HBU1192571.1 hypothetical protein [Klebsiella pneumoniae]HBU1866187.1 hypothetical protein [Klebsiella pneumoniae]